LSVPTKVTQSGEPLPQQSNPAEHTSISGATASESSMPVIPSGIDSQRHLQPHPEVRTFVSRTNAWVCSNSQHRGQTLLCGLLHRKDFEVKRIYKKLLVDQTAVFIVPWKSTWVPAQLIVKGKRVEYPYVDADGTRWYIKRTYGHRHENGIEEVKARWVNTKKPSEMLSNAQEAIDIFEADLQLAGAGELAQVQQRRVLTHRESHFPRGSILPQSEKDYAAAQPWVSSTWPEIRPHKTLDLYPAIYRIHMELADLELKPRHRGKSYRCLMKLPQLRPLR
jgi:hypothetical protein